MKDYNYDKYETEMLVKNYRKYVIEDKGIYCLPCFINDLLYGRTSSSCRTCIYTTECDMLFTRRSALGLGISVLK